MNTKKATVIPPTTFKKIYRCGFLFDFGIALSSCPVVSVEKYSEVALIFGVPTFFVDGSFGC